MINQNFNPLSNFTYDQLMYIYREAPTGSLLASNVASQLSALQASQQRSFESNFTPPQPPERED